MSSWLAGIVGMCVGSALGILIISIVTHASDGVETTYTAILPRGTESACQGRGIEEIDAAPRGTQSQSKRAPDIPPGNHSLAHPPVFSDANKTERLFMANHHCGQEMPEGDQWILQEEIRLMESAHRHA